MSRTVVFAIEYTDDDISSMVEAYNQAEEAEGSPKRIDFDTALNRVKAWWREGIGTVALTDTIWSALVDAINREEYDQ